MRLTAEQERKIKQSSPAHWMQCLELAKKVQIGEISPAEAIKWLEPHKEAERRLAALRQCKDRKGLCIKHVK